MPRALWTPVAEADLDDILFYIAVIDRSPLTGERLYYELRDRVNKQATEGLPRHTHEHAPEGWLYFRHLRWLVFYQPHTEGIEVMRHY